MKILFVCHRFPFPPNRGGKIRPFFVIKHLSAQHEVTVASLVRSSEEQQQAAGIAPYCSRFLMARVQAPWQLLRTLGRVPTPTPASMGYFYSRSLAAQLQRLLRGENFDLIFVHCSSVAQYVVGFRGCPKILDFGDMDSQKWLLYAGSRLFPLSAGYWLEGRKLMAQEMRLARAFDLCTVTTQAELETLNSFPAAGDTDWFPNGVDCEYFKPQAEDYDPHTIAFLGRMDYYPNEECVLDFCRTTLPLIQSRRPEVKLVIVGADPPRSIRRLADMPGITVTGSVPDVRPFLWRSALTIAPLRIARGTQNKILESMAAGVPVVASTTALQGVQAVEGEHLLAADSAAEYAAAILRLLSDPVQRRRFSCAGRDQVLKCHTWDRSMQRFDGILERCLSRHSQQLRGVQN